MIDYENVDFMTNLVLFFRRRRRLSGGLVDAHEVLGDAEVVDHLRDAEERSNDDHPAEGALQESSWSLLSKKQSLIKINFWNIGYDHIKTISLI